MKKMIIIGAILGLVAIGAQAGDELVLDLPLNSSTGITDQSAIKNKTSLTGNAAVEDDALVIKAKKSYLNAGTDKALDLGTGSITIVASFKLNGKQDSRSGLVAKGAGSSKSAGYAFMYRLPKKAFFFYVSNGTKRFGFQSNNDDLNDGKWHTAAVTFNREGEIIFALDGRIRGKRDASDIPAGDIVNPSVSLLVGSWARSFSLIGALKNIRIYKKSCTPAELLALTSQKK